MAVHKRTTAIPFACDRVVDVAFSGARRIAMAEYSVAPANGATAPPTPGPIEGTMVARMNPTSTMALSTTNPGRRAIQVADALSLLIVILDLRH